MRTASSLFQKLIFSFASTRPTPSFISITNNALHRLRSIMDQRQTEKLVGVKISLTKKGCNGLGYAMDYIRQEQIKKFDEVIQKQGVKVIVDSKALMALVGTEMDYTEDELGSQFVFNNPNEKGRCGCGTSFHI